jgi:protein-S-isoprenylcysteine O-methyltransferase Ste14
VAELALLLYLAFLLLAFGLRVAIQLRRTGASGFKGLSGRPGSVEWLTGILFVVALLMGAAAPVLALLDLLEPISGLDTDPVHWLGVALAAAGIGLTFHAQIGMGDSWRIGVDPEERTELVTAGPFALVRNPIYSAMIPTAAGLAMMVPSALALTGLASLLVALELQVRVVEEPYLRQVHGEAYSRYARRVGRFVPAIGRLR